MRWIADTPHIYRVYAAGKDLEFTRRAIKAARSGTLLSKATLAAELRKFHRDLANYVRVLDATSEALTVLEAAAVNPNLSVTELSNVVREAVKIRNAAETFWKEIDQAG